MRHGTDAVLRTRRCRALLFVNAVAPFLLAEEEMIRSRAPLCSLTPSLISSPHFLSHFSSIEPEPWPKSPTRLAGDRELPLQIPDHQHLRRALLPLSARGIEEGSPGSPSPSRSSSPPAADVRASSRWEQATFLRHFRAHVLPLPCSSHGHPHFFSGRRSRRSQHRRAPTAPRPRPARVEEEGSGPYRFVQARGPRAEFLPARHGPNPADPARSFFFQVAYPFTSRTVSGPLV